ncbi:hypothetical protein [Azospirillum sp. sgz302134]
MSTENTTTNVQNVLLKPIRPGDEKRCPTWAGFPYGTIVRYDGCAPSMANTKVTTLEGEVIVEYLPLMHAVARAQEEAARRRCCIRVIGPYECLDGVVMTPEGVFLKEEHRQYQSCGH